ncbi:acylase [Dyadobacter arcticus]|uniref:Acyl-homoserine-lactone acylase n=1 Tax=Dyadobacter arcticus TaxID=1078754 RepID=A0ABX0UK25_9BACT|nr:acylase [Dyadobacter arcticus]NIJ51501.1 acyl-homoserine-lactone acylase [Dyadobacter arcticus]
MIRYRLLLTFLFILLNPDQGYSQQKASYKQAEILWDTWGIPHIYAKNEESLFYAYGWAQAQNHGDLVLKLYGQARGKGAEYWGEKYAESDRWVLLNDIFERAGEWNVKQKPAMRKNLDAFAKGINDYAKENPGKISEEVRAVLPVSAQDVIANVQRVTHFVFLAPSSKVAAALAAQGEKNGSNAWAVGPKKSASGNTLLLTNPHLPWTDLYTYFEAQLVAPGINAYGISRMGFPVLTMAFNDVAGYSQTVNTNDGQDFFELKEKDGGYLWDGKVTPFETKEKILKIKQPDGTLSEEKMVARRSIHGPVVSEKGGRTIAMKIAGLDQYGIFEQYLEMCKARDFEAFNAAVSKLQIPMYTLMFADNQGNIFNLFNGEVPMRPKGDWKFWSGIVPGDTSATLWTKTHPYKDLPKVLNPTTGWLQNTNEPPWTATWPIVNEPADFPSYIAPPLSMSFRTIGSVKMLMNAEKITLDDFIAMKLSTKMELADHILDDLIAAAGSSENVESKEAAKVLASWDRQTETTSKGAFLFDQFVRKWVGGAGKLGTLGTESTMFATPWIPSDPVNTPKGIADKDWAVKALAETALEVKQKYGVVDVPWGDVFRFRIGDVDVPGNGGSGFMGVFRTMTLTPTNDGKFAPSHGETYVAAIEFSKPLKAKALTSYGNASQPGSKHHSDQLPLLSQKKLRPVWFTRKEAEANLEEKTVFK